MDPALELRVLHALGRLYLQQGNLEHAIATIRQAQAVANHAISPDTLLQHYRCMAQEYAGQDDHATTRLYTLQHIAALEQVIARTVAINMHGQLAVLSGTTSMEGEESRR